MAKADFNTSRFNCQVWIILKQVEATFQEAALSGMLLMD
jgi:hypothetical protein